MKRAFLIHGWEGRPDNHWFPWLKMELIARGWEVNAPQLPHAEHPKVLEWISFLKDYVGKPDTNTYFVGHSLGCIAVARYLAVLPAKAKIGGCVFVAGFSGDLNIPEIAEFYLLPQTAVRGQSRTNTQIRVDIMEKAKSHCPRFITIFSDNDSYMSVEKSLAFAKQLGAKTILERGRGHFRVRDDVTALPSVLSALLKMAS